MSTAILATVHDHPPLTWGPAPEVAHATGSGDPFTPIKIIVTWLCAAVIVGCATCAAIELKRYGELVRPTWVKIALGAAVLDLMVLLVLTAFTYL
ncbi:hypothetical protein [Corynebacterium bovis]|uniref:hypothetical protein n=1 Tax=Corynebacterium bovis TaxID=36808 RepID=UPI000F6526AE|nr:hypothetical protein [Corynebacterium bovis]